MKTSAFFFILAALALQATTAQTAILLDNTDNLTRTITTSGTTYGSNTPPFNRVNGASFEVGGTPYDATSVSLALAHNRTTPISLTVVLQFWELPTNTDRTPANGTLIYTENFFNNTVTETPQYYTFSLTPGVVNLKANTRYSLSVLTDGDSDTGWRLTDPSNFASGTGATSVGGFYSTNGGASYSNAPSYSL